MFPTFVLGRENVFPVGDLRIRRMMELSYGGLTRAEVVERAEPWRPYRRNAWPSFRQHSEDGDGEVGGPND